MRLLPTEWPDERRFPASVTGATAYVSCSANSPAVHYPDKSWGPREFSYVEIPDNPRSPMYVVEFRHNDRGLPKVEAVALVRGTAGDEVRNVDLRRLRSLDDLAEDAWAAMASRPLFAVADTAEEAEAGLAAAIAAAEPELRRVMRGVRRQGRRRVTADLLAETAQVYRDGRGSGAPTRAVAEHFGLAPSTASLYVKRARDAGEDMGD
ncbi:MAG TPA: hypothetical protein VGK17_09215 [Propionicimonas sp.]|jgi:hypothetical protein